jgi:hypothetical protein
MPQFNDHEINGHVLNGTEQPAIESTPAKAPDPQEPQP